LRKPYKKKSPFIKKQAALKKLPEKNTVYKKTDPKNNRTQREKKPKLLFLKTIRENRSTQREKKTAFLKKKVRENHPTQHKKKNHCLYKEPLRKTEKPSDSMRDKIDGCLGRIRSIDFFSISYTSFDSSSHLISGMQLSLSDYFS
jgi:hypothetical protein